MRTHAIHKQAPLMTMAMEQAKPKTFRIRHKVNGLLLTTYISANSWEDAVSKAALSDIIEVREW